MRLGDENPRRAAESVRTSGFSCANCVAISGVHFLDVRSFGLDCENAFSFESLLRLYRADASSGCAAEMRGRRGDSRSSGSLLHVPAAKAGCCGRSRSGVDCENNTSSSSSSYELVWANVFRNDGSLLRKCNDAVGFETTNSA